MSAIENTARKPKATEVTPARKEAPVNKDMKTDEKRRSSRVFRRSHGVTEEQLAELTARFPAWGFEFGSEGYHPHPIGATERAINESLVYEDIQRMYGREVRITDIGGNANRHVRCGRTNIHNCNPVLSAADAVRRRPECYISGADYCTNTSQKCPLIPDVYMSIHSIYYLSKDDVLNFVLTARKHRLFAVAHNFNNLYGSFGRCGGKAESNYEVSWTGKELSVHMRVHGNHTGYTHSASTWIFETNYYTNGQFAMAWTSRPAGDSFILEFVEAPMGLQPEEALSMPLVDCLNRNDFHGKVDGVVTYGDQAKFRPMLESLAITRGTTLSLGSFTLTVLKSTEHVLIPKSLITTVGNQMIGIKRDSTTFASCIQRMRAALKTLNVPPSMQTKCLTYGSAMAFIYSLQDEITAYNTLCMSPIRRMFNQLSNALSLKELPCCSTTADVTYSKFERTEKASALSSLYTRDRVTPPITGSCNMREAFPKGLPGVECSLPLAPMDHRAKLKDFGADERLEQAPQLFVNTPVFTPIQAVVPNPSKNNELRALANRALVKTYDEDLELWQKVHKRGIRLSRHFTEVEDEYDDLFCTWNKKFPLAQQNRNLLAYARVKADGLTNKDLIMKMFIKREVTLKTGEAFEDFDPRAIQGCTDEMNVSYGPFIWHAGKKLCKEWTLTERICYTSGLTSEEVGTWRASFGEDPALTFVELDESRYDAHQGEGVAELSRIMKRAFGIKNYDLPNQVEENTFIKNGRSKFFSYEVAGTMTSGKADTSMSNSWVNGVKLDFLLKTFGFKETDYRMLVNGDDSLVVINRTMSPDEREHLKIFLVEKNKSLGFKTKCKVRTEWHEVEYCSGLFWPVADGYVLGPKIGRRLPKLGFSIRNLDDSEVVSLVQGMRNDLAHLPVLSVYYTHCLRYTSKMKTKPNKQYIDKEAKYKSNCSVAHTRCQATDLFFLARYGYTTHLCEDSLNTCLAQTQTLTDAVTYPLMDAFALDL